MTDKTLYVASAGQTHIPFQENEGVPFVPFERPAKPEPPLAPLELTQEAIDKGYDLPSQRHHFLPGLTSEMLDWFWANMEKGYYLWAPGSHKRFNWLKTPYEYGFEDSVHIIAETSIRLRQLSAMLYAKAFSMMQESSWTRPFTNGKMFRAG